MENYIRKAMRAFPNSFINRNNELILIPKFNVYFLLDDIYSELIFNCKILEWVSRDCTSALRYIQTKRLESYWNENRIKVNTILNTNFTKDDMELIYTYLGNSVNRLLTFEFIESGYDMQILEKYAKAKQSKLKIESQMLVL